MKRVISLFAVLALFLAACTVDKPTSVTEKHTSYENPPCPEISTAVICDSEVLTITVTGIEYNSTYKTYVVKTNIQNHSPRTIHYSLDRAKVNGYTISAFVFGDIYSNMEANADFGLPHDEISLAGIKAIEELEFDYICQYSDDDEKICTASADLKTSDYGSITEEYSFEGTEIYSSDEYTIMLAPNDNPSVSHPLKVYVENKTNHPLKLMYESIAINQMMVGIDLMTGAYVLPLSRRIEEMSITYFGEKPKVDTINSVTLGVDILPYDTDGSVSTADEIELPAITINMNE